MRCLACDKNLTDREASIKFADWKDIPNPEDRFVQLCEDDIQGLGIATTVNLAASDEEYQDDKEVSDEQEED